MQDRRGARKEAEFLVDSSLLQEVDASFPLHDLLLDFISVKYQGEDALIEGAVERQSQYPGRLAVLWGYFNNGEFREGLYSLIDLWRKLVELSGRQAAGGGYLQVLGTSVAMGPKTPPIV